MSTSVNTHSKLITWAKTQLNDNNAVDDKALEALLEKVITSTLNRSAAGNAYERLTALTHTQLQARLSTAQFHASNTLRKFSQVPNIQGVEWVNRTLAIRGFVTVDSRFGRNYVAARTVDADTMVAVIDVKGVSHYLPIQFFFGDPIVVAQAVRKAVRKAQAVNKAAEEKLEAERLEEHERQEAQKLLEEGKNLVDTVASLKCANLTLLKDQKKLLADYRNLVRQVNASQVGKVTQDS